MSARTLAALQDALEDDAVLARYRGMVSPTPTPRGCRLWTGAVSGKGHGRFWIGSYQEDGQTRDIVVIAHRFGWAIEHGLRSLLCTEQVTHRCDEALCQEPSHWAAGTNATNQVEYAMRRTIPGSPLRDTRGQRGRALALRDAARSGNDVSAITRAGQPLGDAYQPSLFEDVGDDQSA